MPTAKFLQDRILILKSEYEKLRPGKESLLRLLDESELSETVYNSNAIENSTLTMKETEDILMEIEISRKVSLREVFEAKNLGRVIEYLNQKNQDLDKDLILLIHKMLISNIEDSIAGRFRSNGEYVRVGTHVAPAPEKIEELLSEALVKFNSDLGAFLSDRVAAFHTRFEHIHPFNDGNGRIGRVLINYQLRRLGFPYVIIRNKEKQQYYRALEAYDIKMDTKPMEKIVALAIMESLHKRLAYLRGDKIVTLVGTAKEKSANSLINAARRQTIPAFREKGVWKIGV